MRLIRNFIVLAGVVLSGGAQAQVVTSSAAVAVPDVVADDLSDEFDDVLEQIVVTGSRTSKRAADAPVATDVVDRAAIQASGAASLEDVLETQPGLQLERGANSTGVRIQGFNPEQVLVLVDGERIAGRVRDQFDLRQIDLENVERVEIVRGAASALYGSDAMGGVVNVITRRAKKPLSASARGTFGTQNVVDAIGSVGSRRGRFTTNVSGGYHRADAYDLDTTDGPSPEASPTNGDERSSWNVAAVTGYEADADTRAELKLRYRSADLQGIGLVGERAVIDRAERIDRLTVSGGPEIDLDDASKLRVSIVHSRYRQQIVQDQRGVGATEFDSIEDNRQVSNQVEVQYDRLIGDHFVSAGVSGLHEQQEVDFLEDGIQDRRRGAIFVQDEWTVFEDTTRLMIIPSGRIDTDSQFGTRPSPRLAVRWDPSRDVILRASYGWGFRAPTFENLYLVFTNTGSGYRINGNRDLQPERSQGLNFDVAYELRRGLTLTGAAFYNDIEDLIDTLRFEPTDANIPCGVRDTNLSQFCYVNVGEAKTMGASFGATYDDEEYLTASASVDLLATSGTYPNDPVEPEHELPNRPNFRGTVQITGRVPEWRTQLVVRATFEGAAETFVDLDNDGEDDIRPAHALVDLRVSHELYSLNVFAGVENLLNVYDADHLPIRPRTFYAGIQGSYDILPTKEDDS